MRRLDSGLLAFLGVLAVHQIAYSISRAAGAPSAIDHGHLAVAWLLAGLAAVAGLTLAVTRSLRARRHHVGSRLLLAGIVAAGYTALEAIERAADGIPVSSLVTEAVFWLGLAAAPIVAVALSAMVRAADDLVRAFIEARTAEWPAAAPPSLFPTSVVLQPVLLRSESVSRRGPPVRSHH